MRYQISLSRKKLIVGGVLCVLWGILLPISAAATFSDYFVSEPHYYLDESDFARVVFDVEVGFTIQYEDGEGDYCRVVKNDGCKSTYQFYNSDYGLCWSHYHDWVSGLTLGQDKENCDDITDVYEAGKNYEVYLVHGEAVRPGQPVNTGKLYQDNDLRVGYTETPTTTIYLFFRIGTTEYSGEKFYFKQIPPFPYLTIDSPASGITKATAFTMEITYEATTTEYNQLMIIFEDWDASSTCPVYGTSQWETEYPLYFNYQSLPYFSPIFSIGTAGTTTISISDLVSGDYRCVRCYFINGAKDIISSEKCKAFTIEILTYIPPPDIPDLYLPFQNWSDYYASNSERFTTSTPLFENWADTFEPLINWIGSTILSFQIYFDVDVAAAKGVEMGNAIATARGYVESIDDFFGGLPLSAVFIFYLITAIVVIVYRLVRGLLTIIVP